MRLKAPPPLQASLQINSDGAKATLMDQSTVVAEAQVMTLALEVPDAPDIDSARAASKAFLGFDEKQHPFPSCFVCGPRREPGDGLCIFPGKVSEQLLACTWVPDASLGGSEGKVAREFLWAALDCPGAFAVMPVPPGKAIVLGELCVEIIRDIPVGQECVVCAWPIATEGRKHLAGSAIFSTEGERVAKARATWIEIPLEQWQ